MSDTPGRNQRLDATIPVRFADAREFLVEYSSNISMGGVFVRTSSPAAFGTVVRLSLELPGSGQSVPITGQVAFVLPPDQAARQGKTPGMGVRFARLDPAVQETLASYVSGLQRKSKGRVLLVDDDPLTLAQLGDTLRRYNLNVVTASSAIKALEVVRFGGIDFVISDINMPRMDGFEFRDNLRNNPKTANIPFIFLTASVSDGDRQVATELGVQNFLIKPFNEPQLVAMLRQVLGEGAFAEDAPGVPGVDPIAQQKQLEDKASRQKQQQRRIVEIAYRKFVSLGLDTRFTADERGVFGQLVFKTATIQDPVSGQKLERAGLYSVGHDRAKPFWPRALATLPFIPILDLPDAAALERILAGNFQKRFEMIRGVKQFLDRLQIKNRYDPATLRVLGQVKLGRDEVVFTVRDQKTLFLESLNGRSFGSVAAMRARLIDIGDAQSGVDIEIEIETVCKRLQEEFATRVPQRSGPAIDLGADIPEMSLGDLAPAELAPAELAPAEPPPAVATPRAAAAPVASAGAWIGESDDAPIAARAPEAEAMPEGLLEPVGEVAAEAEPVAEFDLGLGGLPAAGSDPFAAPMSDEALFSGEAPVAHDPGLWSAGAEDAAPAEPIGEEALDWSETPAAETFDEASFRVDGADAPPVAEASGAEDSWDAPLDDAAPATDDPILEAPSAAENAVPQEAASPEETAPVSEPIAEAAWEAPAVEEAAAPFEGTVVSAPMLDERREPGTVADFLDAVGTPAPTGPAATPEDAHFAGGEVDLVTGGESLSMASDPEPPKDPAQQWADEWTGDESQPEAVGAMQPQDLMATERVPAAAEAPAVAPGSAPAESADSTVLICNNCGQYYSIGDSVEDERLLLLCPACIAKGA